MKRTLTLIALGLVAAVAAVAVVALATRATAQPAPAAPTATAVPVEQPAAPPASGAPYAPAGLKYDETGCNAADLAACRNSGQTQFVAILVRNIQSGDRTLTDGIVAIQQLFAATPGSRTWDKWSTLSVDPVWPTFVWCPKGTCTWVPDTAFPLMGIPALAHVQYTIAIVSAHSPLDPPAAITDVSCPQGDCWAGLLR